jgi:hypothetical protein
LTDLEEWVLSEHILDLVSKGIPLDSVLWKI